MELRLFYLLEDHKKEILKMWKSKQFPDMLNVLKLEINKKKQVEEGMPGSFFYVEP